MLLFVLVLHALSMETLSLQTSSIATSGDAKGAQELKDVKGYIIQVSPENITTVKGEIEVLGKNGEKIVARVKNPPNSTEFIVDKDVEIDLIAQMAEVEPTDIQFYLENTGNMGGFEGEDIGVKAVWESGYRGKNITIAILDDGIFWRHTSISQNFDMSSSYDFLNTRQDPSPDDIYNNNHGTACAGVSSSRTGSSCGVGVAPNTTLSGIVMLGRGLTVSKWASALLYKNDKVAIKSNSYGPGGCKISGCPFTYLYPTIENAVKESVTSGRNGLGTVLTFAAGNNGLYGGDMNYFDVAKLPYIISVAASSNIGARIFYSNRGTALMVNAPSAGKAQETMASNDYPGIATITPQGCTSSFSGTSASTPIVSGVIALMLESNPNLTYRDIQMIIALTSTKNDPSHFSWIENAAGYRHSSVYGFGRINAEEAVNMAKSWSRLPEQKIVKSDLMIIDRSMPDGNELPLEISITLLDNVNFIETASIIMSFTHTSSCDLDIILESPRGTKSKIKIPCIDQGTNTFSGFPMFSRQFFGEHSGGTWKLYLYDRLPGHVGYLENVQLIVYGFNQAGRSLQQSSNTGKAFQVFPKSELFNIVDHDLSVTKGGNLEVHWEIDPSFQTCPIDYYITKGSERGYLGSSSRVDREGITIQRFPTTVSPGDYRFLVHSQICGFSDSVPITVHEGSLRGCSVTHTYAYYTIEWADNMTKLPYDGYDGNYIVSILNGDRPLGRCACAPYGRCTCSLSANSDGSNLNCVASYVGEIGISRINDAQVDTNSSTYSFNPSPADDYSSTPMFSDNHNQNSFFGSPTFTHSPSSTPGSNQFNWTLYGAIAGAVVILIIGCITVAICVRKKREPKATPTI